ncbi:polysaccharide deacetylase family protein [Gordonia sp. (in: high G+C Gram-positive bacteria)]|uniref:polysaccharide deacetylase family protein n=1 Tax=Gordonia sp. (in: high G+C Gram-positive bacteria) TaxID=84139 RepID=UPI0039E22D1F
MDRRDFLTALVGAGVLAGCSPSHSATPRPRLPLAGRPPAVRVPVAELPVTRLPGPGRYLALTVDDGASPEVVAAYCRFARDTGARFTFFVTGHYASWRENRDLLRPLVDTGQVQLGNHTWTHPDLTSLTEQACADELQQTKVFLRNEFGVDGTPYYRPPFGYRNDAVDRVAADLGYTVPTLWEGSLSDSGLITEQFLVGQAREYLQAQHVVIGHANFPTVTHVYDEIMHIIVRRGLQMVTLADYFLPPPAPHTPSSSPLPTPSL